MLRAILFVFEQIWALHQIKPAIKTMNLVSIHDPCSHKGVSHKPHLAPDLSADLLCFVAFDSSVATALRSKLKVRIRIGVWSPGGLWKTPGASHKPQGVVSQATLGGCVHIYIYIVV